VRAEGVCTDMSFFKLADSLSGSKGLRGASLIDVMTATTDIEGQNRLSVSAELVGDMYYHSAS